MLGTNAVNEPSPTRNQGPAREGALGGLHWSPGKITPPSLSAVARIARLFAALDAALERPIVWLQGPPGAGKTTLIAGWLLERRIEPIWQRLDADDSDPSTLFFYLGMAEARARGAGAARRLPLLTPEFQFGTATFSRNFFQKLFEGPDWRIVVLDDYHEMTPVSPVHQLLANGLKEIPEGGHVVIVSRFPPPKEYARLRVNGQMEVLAPQLLVLHAGEAEDIICARGASLDAAWIEQALDLTQGWAAGLILLVEAARSGSETKAGPGAAPELMFDYFAGEVLQGLSERERRALVSLAVMPSMSAAAAEQLTGDSAAGALLERLARRGYFTTRDADEEPHFRFHPLFRQFLFEQARQTIDASESASLKLRAAKILEECHQPEAAVALLREAAAWEELARLILAWAKRMTATGRHKVLASWINLLPPERLEADGWLLYWAAAAAAPFSSAESHPLYRRALKILTQSGDGDGALLAASGLAVSILSDDIADQEPLDEMIVVLRGLVARFPDFSSPFIEAYVGYALHGALTRRTSERAEIAYWRDRALAAVSIAGDPKLAAMVRLGVIVFALVDAKFAVANDGLAAMASPEALKDAPYERSIARFATIFAQIHRQAPGSCVDTASAAAQEDAAAGVVFHTGTAAAIAAIDCLALGQFEQARAWLDRSAAHLDRASSRRSPIFHVASAFYFCATGDMIGAEKAARRGIDTSLEIHFPHHESISRLTLAQVAILSGNFVEAETQLAATEAAMDRSASDVLRFRLNMTRAAMFLKSGRRPQGLSALRNALAEGEKLGAGRFLAVNHSLASPLYSEALAQDMSPAFVRLLIRNESMPPPDGADADWPWPLKIIALGGFHLFKDGTPLRPSRKTPRRLFNVLKAIVAFGGRDVAQEKIIDAVWPDEDGDSARISFEAAVHRLRKLLGDSRLLVVRNGKIGLDPARCWLDLWAFEADASGRGGLEGDARALEFYGGDFLAGDEDLPWAEPVRNKLRAQFVKLVGKRIAVCVANRDYESAVDVYRRGIDACPDAESICQGFMRCCEAFGRRNEALEAYRNLRAVLADVGRSPSQATIAQFRALNT
jgi:ATP/maltotriose-dependent transcriptional regulator MalT/DNA-binding SARP family transcriptional activator